MRLTASVSVLIAGFAAVAWGQSPDFTVCEGDLNNDGTVAINEIITAVGNSLEGCRSADFTVCPGDLNYDGTRIGDRPSSRALSTSLRMISLRPASRDSARYRS